MYKHPRNVSKKVLFNSIKREQRYYKFKLDVYRERRREGRKETDPVLEVTPTEVGHLKIYIVRVFLIDFSTCEDKWY